MIHNGEIPAVLTVIYTAPPNSNGAEINFFRVVNDAAAARTFTLYLNVNGTARAFTPVDLNLPANAAYDDVPTFQLKAGDTIEAIASAATVMWTINAVEL